ncbi:helicase [Pokkaliibacter plantistimulans]|uniref:Helicase n=1 Tax=Pokkaliibacter plantistimulans TaxID=1635171 RepID=A0ABX5M0T3_9GAMM|nr:DEAD/DEAH box helicase [Pokkaliibacter plantistimulans]PXF32497.1 helicase [Pokkaliibacter plantistimulans]
MSNIAEIREKIKSQKWTDDPFSLLSDIASICSSNINMGRDLVIRALENQDSLGLAYREILNDLTMQVGLYPYVSNLGDLSLRNALMHAAHRADGIMGDYVLHRSQARVLHWLMSGSSVILSAPTSFGKSLLIDIIISAKKFDNVVLIVPTLALVEETRRRMSRFVEEYSIVTSSNQKITERNIFVLTQERYLSMEEEIPEADFFVIDEFYKLSISNDGGRSTLLNQAFLRLCNTGAQFYLLGPSIKSIPDVVKEKLNCKFLVEDFQTVAIELHFLRKKPNRNEALAKLLDEIEGQTMVYCQSPASTRKLIKSYLDIRKLEITQDQELLEAAKWTSENYHDKWLVSVALRHGIGIHHGRLPRSLGRFMIRAFEEGKIKVLLCTSTLIEGVNTSAKNVVIYDNKLNKKSLDFFTFSNIKGRTGRMFRHFIGNIFVFDAPPEEELPFVDMPAINPGENTPSSLLINLPAKDIPASLREKVETILNQKLLPIELLKRHSGIEPEYLLDTANHLLKSSYRDLERFAWSSKPQYDDIKLTSEIIWTQLGGAPSARQGAMRSASMMTLWVWKLYASRNVPRFRREMISNQIVRNTSPDEAVENVLAFLRGWASFNYPKYLIALNDVANHVLQLKGLRSCNYLPFAMTIEHLFQPSSFSALEEYGLPTEISEKFLNERIFKKDDSLDVVVNNLRNRELSRFGDSVFEKRVIEDFQRGIGAKIG